MLKGKEGRKEGKLKDARKEKDKETKEKCLIIWLNCFFVSLHSASDHVHVSRFLFKIYKVKENTNAAKVKNKYKIQICKFVKKKRHCLKMKKEMRKCSQHMENMCNVCK